MICGRHYNLPSDEYHADKESISRSALMDFKKNPRLYWANHINPDRPTRKTTPAMNFGSAFHTFVLEPDLFNDTYILKPEKKTIVKDGREARDAYTKLLADMILKNQIILSDEDMKTLFNMRSALQNHPKAWSLIEGGVYESSYIWLDRHSGLIVKSRPDILQSNMYVDLKTIDDASPQGFQRAMAVHGYHIQAAMVMDGYFELTGEKLSAAINICVEKTYPYLIGIYIIDEAAIEAGHCEYKQLLLDLKECIINNDWRDYETQTIGLPKWAL